MSSRFNSVIALIDNANSKDPNTELVNGENKPKELIYSQRMTEHLIKFEAAASENLQIAARGQHIERWTSLRSNYPEGRAGYKKWRAELGLFHAQRVGELMIEAGYSAEDADRTKYIVQKRGLRKDPETQCLEDVICLVFLDFYLDDFAVKHTEEKLIDIIQKTWGKMSEKGHTAALNLKLSQEMQTLVGKALS